MMNLEYYKFKACDILYASGNPESIDKEFVENVVTRLLMSIDELEEELSGRLTDLERRMEK